MTRENGLLDHTEQNADGNAFLSAWSIIADANMYKYLQMNNDKVRGVVEKTIKNGDH